MATLAVILAADGAEDSDYTKTGSGYSALLGERVSGELTRFIAHKVSGIKERSQQLLA